MDGEALCDVLAALARPDALRSLDLGSAPP